MKDTYTDLGYGKRTVGFGTNLAILVVDFQNAFLDESYPLGKSPRLSEAAKCTAELLSVGREYQIPIIYTVVAYRNEVDLGNWKADLGWITPGSHAAEVAEIVKPDIDDPVLVKKMPSAFFGTELTQLLTHLHVDTVIVTGCVTSGCIRATVIDSFSFGYKTIVAEDCVGDFTEKQHRANLFDVSQRYADLCSRKEIIEHIRRECTHR